MQHVYSLRGFLNEVERNEPSELLRIKAPLDRDYDINALVMELDARQRAPVLWAEKVIGSPFPVVANIFGDRGRLATSLGVGEEELLERWSRVGETVLPPILVAHGAVQERKYYGDDANLDILPIMRHFADDAGAYITNALVVAKHPDSGIRNASFHRMQVKGARRLGTSLHSRRHLWTYQQLAEERGEDLPIAIIVGAHPLITMGGIWKGAIGTDEYAVMGGMMGQPMPIVPALTVPLEVPAEAEIVIEGYIKAGAREDEGPFGEFTGYSSERSTRNVVEVTAITHREAAIYQDIIPGISNEHTNLLGAPQEARLFQMLRQQYPNVVDVCYPKSGTCRLHAYIRLHKPTPGQARNAAAMALGDDLSLKLVIVVNEDVNIRSDSEVLWACATRMQAGRDIDVLHNAMGAILDPSNYDGLTDKMIIDATQHTTMRARRHIVPVDAAIRAAEVLDQTGGG